MHADINKTFRVNLGTVHTGLFVLKAQRVGCFRLFDAVIGIMYYA